jgi:hypothetical protein
MKMARMTNVDENVESVQFDGPVTLQIITSAGGIIQTVVPANTEIKIIKPEKGWDVKISFVITDELPPLGPGLVKE